MEGDNVKDEDDKEQGSSVSGVVLAGSKLSTWVSDCCSALVTMIFVGGDVTMSMSAKKTKKVKQVCTTRNEFFFCSDAVSWKSRPTCLCVCVFMDGLGNNTSDNDKQQTTRRPTMLLCILYHVVRCARDECSQPWRGCIFGGGVLERSDEEKEKTRRGFARTFFMNHEHRAWPLSMISLDCKSIIGP